MSTHVLSEQAAVGVDRALDAPWWGRSLFDRRLRAALLAVAALVAMAIPGLLAAGGLYLYSVAIADAVAVLSIVVLTGMAGQLSLAQAAFMGVGAITAAHLEGGGVPFLIAVPIGAIAAVPIGLIAAIPALRVRGIQLAIVTLAYGQILQRVFFDAPINGGLGGLPVRRPGIVSGDVAYARMEILVFAGLAALVTLMATRRTGRNLTLLRESETAALAAGVDLTRAKLAVFAVSAAIAGVAGGLLAGVSGVATAGDFTPFVSIGLLAVAVIGGLASPVGAAAGGLLLACAPSWIAQLPIVSRFGDAASMVFGVGLIVGLIAAPRGVAGQLRDVERLIGRAFRRVLVEPARRGEA